MLHSIATVSVSGSLTEKLAAIAEAGFAGVEIFEADLIGSPERPETIARMIRDLGLVCTAWQPFRDFEGLSGALRDKVFDRAERKFDLMQTLGAKDMLVCSSLHPEASGDPARIADDFRELGDRAAARGLRVGYEALAWGRHINDHRQVWDIVQAVDHPAIGIILDTFHSLSRDIPISSLEAIDPAKIVLVQVADAPRLQMDHLSWSRHHRCMPGQGEFAVNAWVEALARRGYDGPLSLEIFNDDFRAWSAHQIAKDGKRSLVLVEEAIAPQATAFPPRVPASGPAFVEFAMTEAEAEPMRAMLASLGFIKAGLHRTMAVEHWRLGQVHIVINREQTGFAASYRLLHGPSVCAIGVTVDDPAAALARAEALGMEVFPTTVAPPRLPMPAIRGVGAALIHLVDARGPSPWAVEFEAPDDGVPDALDAHIAGIDHLSQSMQHEEFLSWQLFYCALFQVDRTRGAEVADPLGLVDNQAVEAPDRGLRFMLIGAHAGQTLASRFIHRSFGAGVQHIAIATDDIFAAAERLAALRAPILEISPNYHDDLAARFDIAPEVLERMRAGNILYDRGDDGEVFQIYTRALDKGVFFEFVQRRGYDGYSAVNTQARLAAQSRFRPALQD